MGRVVLVTGVSRDLGGRLALSLTNDPEVDRVVGVDAVPPRREMSGVGFVRLDIRSPVIAKVIASEAVDTVVHLGVLAASSAGTRSSMKEINVIGTMQLLAACQRAPMVRRLVVKSSARVYGSSPRDPALFSEGMAAKRLPRAGYARDSVEVEGYVRGFARRRPDVAVTTLRCANLLGPTVDTTLSRHFELPVIPTVLGFDARLQFLHEDDAVAALERAVSCGSSGTFNVAGDGIMMLSQCVRRLGRPSIALPRAAFGRLATLSASARSADLSREQATYLCHGRGLDTTAMREQFGFRPVHTTPSAFDAFASRLRLSATQQPQTSGDDAATDSTTSVGAVGERCE